MPVPWLRVLDAVLNLTDLARRVNRRSLSALTEPGESTALQTPPTGGTALEARLAGVVVAALKEAFDRDNQRLQLEREQREAERKRAERLLKLELLRQAGDRELARLRVMTGVAMAGWLGTMLLAAFGPASNGSRIAFGLGWLLLLAALATTLIAQSQVSAALTRITERDDAVAPVSGAGAATPWLLVAGLAVIGAGMLVR